MKASMTAEMSESKNIIDRWVAWWDMRIDIKTGWTVLLIAFITACIALIAAVVLYVVYYILREYPIVLYVCTALSSITIILWFLGSRRLSAHKTMDALQE